MFDEWAEDVGRAGPVAFVGQDGIEDLDIPWDRFSAWFIGGSTVWKLSAASADMVEAALARGKWVHMGRVNSRKRMELADALGCHSFDGTSTSMFPDIYIEKYLRWVSHLKCQRRLFQGL